MRVEELDLKSIIENETGSKFTRNNKICCPIHNEKTPSLSLDTKRNKWHCFGCGRGGDAIDFISELKGLNYIEACKYLNVDLNEEYKIIVEGDDLNLCAIIEQMQSYIRAKGATQIGPLIQYTRTFILTNVQFDVENHSKR